MALIVISCQDRSRPPGLRDSLTEAEASRARFGAILRITVSGENVERSRQFIEAFNTSDVERYLPFFDPAGEFRSAFAAVGGEVYHGHEGLRRYHQDMQDAWGEELQIESEAYFDLGEQTLCFYTLHARGKQSDVDVAMPIAIVFQWRDHLIVYCKGYAHREDALNDLGVSEDELEPIVP